MKEVAEFLKQNDEACQFVYFVLCLEFLPHQQIIDAYQSVKKTLHPNVVHQMKNFINYYERWWLKTVKPINFSIYGHALRTTNPIEGYHANSKRKLGIHPDPPSFMSKKLFFLL